MAKGQKTLVGLLVGFGAMFAALGVATVGSYALFSDQVKIDTHLKAGTMKVTLERTAHSYSILDNDGKLKETKVTSEKVASKDITNAFGLPEAALIVPGSKMSATFDIANKETVAFNYSIDLILKDTSGTPVVLSSLEQHSFASQLKVELTGLTGTHTLADDNLTVNGTEAVKANSKASFTLSVEFTDSAYNNLVQDKQAQFDIVVSATQAA